LISYASHKLEERLQRGAFMGLVYHTDAEREWAYDRSGKANLGHALGTAVLIELQRRRCEVGYVFTPGGLEVDFLAADPEGGRRTLLQVAADLSDKGARERGIRALTDARPTHRRADALPCCLHLPAATCSPPSPTCPPATLRTVWEWMLET